MKKTYLLYALCTFMAALFTSCDDTETYAEQKEREQEIIKAFLSADTRITLTGEELCYVGNITVIDEDEFLKDTLTRCELDAEGNYIHNEYVQLNTGLLLQIVRRGAGEMLQEGQSKQLVARFFEYNMSYGTVTSRNTTNEYHRYPDILDVSNSYGTISGSFNTTINGGGAMYRNYGITSVPEGWLAALRFVKIGYQTTADTGIAKVRMIVPHTLGHTTATSNVHPYFYEITFQELY